MPGWKGIVGKSFSVAEFDSYCHTLQWTAWRPSFLVVHNTATPSLKERPKGFTKQHMLNLESYYRDKKKWIAGPHLFIDDKKIWAFTPMIVSGVHSPSWNKISLGIEMLGDYEKESFTTGRGKQVRTNTIAALATLCAILGFDPITIRIHREDPVTDHACPGKNVKKLEIIQEVQTLMSERHAGEHSMDEHS